MSDAASDSDHSRGLCYPGTCEPCDVRRGRRRDPASTTANELREKAERVRSGQEQAFNAAVEKAVANLVDLAQRHAAEGRLVMYDRSLLNESEAFQSAVFAALRAAPHGLTVAEPKGDGHGQLTSVEISW